MFVGIGTVVNVATVLAGAVLGVLLGNRLPARTRDLVTDGLGLVTLLIAATSAWSVLDPALAAEVGNSAPMLIVLGSLLVGGIVGSLARLEQRVESLGGWLQRRLAGGAGSEERHRFIEGFVSSSLIFCTGPLTILGSLSDGLGRGADQLFLKATLDGFAAIAFAASFGWGVAAADLLAAFAAFDSMSQKIEYFFADFCNQWIHVLNPNTRVVQAFASDLAPFVVDLDVRPDGPLLYLSRGSWAGGDGSGSIHLIQYLPKAPPTLAHPPADQLVSVGHSATFVVSPAGSGPFQYQWQRNGQNIPGATSSQYTTPAIGLDEDGARYRVVITNTIGKLVSGEARLEVTTAQPPTAFITSPDISYKFHNADLIVVTGDGADSQGILLPDLAFTWQVDLHHDRHYHPVVPPTRGLRSVAFRAEPHGMGSGDLSYLITLTVTDPLTGISTTVKREVFSS